ncbi:hypothetical protein BJX61DRAFT_499964 [Aspergillus egyptiacus]|nr:hypothetical protein BJX61DRAFT_499964 [Aspergillus egyptiacus]
MFTIFPFFLKTVLLQCSVGLGSCILLTRTQFSEVSQKHLRTHRFQTQKNFQYTLLVPERDTRFLTEDSGGCEPGITNSKGRV